MSGGAPLAGVLADLAPAPLPVGSAPPLDLEEVSDFIEQHIGDRGQALLDMRHLQGLSVAAAAAVVKLSPVRVQELLRAEVSRLAYRLREHPRWAAFVEAVSDEPAAWQVPPSGERHWRTLIEAAQRTARVTLRTRPLGPGLWLTISARRRDGLQLSARDWPSAGARLLDESAAAAAVHLSTTGLQAAWPAVPLLRSVGGLYLPVPVDTGAAQLRTVAVALALHLRDSGHPDFSPADLQAALSALWPQRPDSWPGMLDHAVHDRPSQFWPERARSPAK